MTTYQPGVCNIGPAERRKRLLGGWAALVVAVLMLVGFVVFQVPDLWRVVIALPVALAAHGFLQSAMHFCVGFAMRGLYNMGTSLGPKESVMQKEMRRKDQRKALVLVGWSALIAAAAVAVAVLLP